MDCGGGGDGDWTRIGFINMSEPGTTCPIEEQFDMTYSLCGNMYLSSSLTFGCNSMFFQSYRLSYTKVCGRVRGYTCGRGLSFVSYHFDPNIDDVSEPYLSGVSITHGIQHTSGHMLMDLQRII